MNKAPSKSKCKITDPSEIKNDVNGFDLVSCKSITPMRLVLCMPNLGYGFMANVLARLKTKGSVVIPGPNFTYNLQSPVQSSSAAGVIIDGYEIFVPVSGETKSMFVADADINSFCSNNLTFNSEFMIPLPLMVKIPSTDTKCIAELEDKVRVAQLGSISEAGSVNFDMIRKILESSDSTDLTDIMCNGLVAEIFRFADITDEMNTFYSYTAFGEDPRVEYSTLMGYTKPYFTTISEGAADVDIAQIYAKPSVLVEYSEESSKRYYYNKDFSNQVLRSLTIRGSSTPPSVELTRSVILPEYIDTVSEPFVTGITHQEMMETLSVKEEHYIAMTGQKTGVTRFFGNSKIAPISGLTTYRQSGEVFQNTTLVTVRPPVYCAGEAINDHNRLQGAYTVPMSFKYVLPATTNGYMTVEAIEASMYGGQKEYTKEGFSSLAALLVEYQNTLNSFGSFRYIFCDILNPAGIKERENDFSDYDGSKLGFSQNLYGRVASFSELGLIFDSMESGPQVGCLLPQGDSIDSLLTDHKTELIEPYQVILSGALGISETPIEIDTSKMFSYFVTTSNEGTVTGNSAGINTFDKQTFQGAVIGKRQGQTTDSEDLVTTPRTMSVSNAGKLDINSIFKSQLDRKSNAEIALEMISEFPAVLERIRYLVEEYSLKLYNPDNQEKSGPLFPRSRFFDVLDTQASGVITSSVSTGPVTILGSLVSGLNRNGSGVEPLFTVFNKAFRDGVAALTEIVNDKVSRDKTNLIESMINNTFFVSYTNLGNVADTLMYGISGSMVFSGIGESDTTPFEITIPSSFYGKGLWFYNIRKVYMLLISLITFAISLNQKILKCLYGIVKGYEASMISSNEPIQCPLKLYSFTSNGEPLYPIVKDDIAIGSFISPGLNTIERIFPAGSMYYEFSVEIPSTQEGDQFYPVVMPGIGVKDSDLIDTPEHRYFWGIDHIFATMDTPDMDSINAPFDRLAETISPYDYMFKSGSSIMVQNDTALVPVPTQSARLEIVEKNAISNVRISPATIKGKIDSTYIFPFVSALGVSISMATEMVMGFSPNQPEDISSITGKEQIQGYCSGNINGPYTDTKVANQISVNVASWIHTNLRNEECLDLLYNGNNGVSISVVGLSDPTPYQVSTGLVASDSALQTFLQIEALDPGFDESQVISDIDASLESDWKTLNLAVGNPDRDNQLLNFNLFLSKRRAFSNAVLLAKDLLAYNNSTPTACTGYKFWFEYSATEPTGENRKVFQVMGAYGFGSLFGNAKDIKGGAAGFEKHRVGIVTLAYGNAAQERIAYGGDTSPVNFDFPREKQTDGVVRISENSPYTPATENGKWTTTLSYDIPTSECYNKFLGTLMFQTQADIEKLKELSANPARRAKVAGKIENYIAKNIDRFKINDSILDNIWLIIEKQ